MDFFNTATGRKIKLVLLGLVGLIALAFGANELGTNLVDNSQKDLSAPAVSPTTV